MMQLRLVEYIFVFTVEVQVYLYVTSNPEYIYMYFKRIKFNISCYIFFDDMHCLEYVCALKQCSFAA